MQIRKYHANEALGIGNNRQENLHVKNEIATHCLAIGTLTK